MCENGLFSFRPGFGGILRIGTRERTGIFSNGDVYNTQNYRVSGLRPVSRIINTRKQIILETGSVPILR
jgi:hypothetical protein